MFSGFTKRILVIVAVAAAFGCGPIAAQPSAAANRAFDNEAVAIAERAAKEDASRAMPTEVRSGLLRGETVIDEMGVGADGQPAGAMLHHWRGRVFVAGATAAELNRVMRDFDDYPNRFAPQVLSAAATARDANHFHAVMRVRQKLIITVVMVTDYDVEFAELSPTRGVSASRSTRIAELDAPGTPRERELDAAHGHGFLWRQNTYWSYAEADGGLWLSVESLSLSRAIPEGLAWAVGPFVRSVPRESLEFTLGAVAKALRPQEATKK